MKTARIHVISLKSDQKSKLIRILKEHFLNKNYDIYQVT